MKSGELIEALKAGKILYRLVGGGPEMEFVFMSHPTLVEVRGFGSALGTPMDRMREIIFNPQDWSIHHVTMEAKVYPWSTAYVETMPPTKEEKEFVLNRDERSLRIQEGYDAIILYVKKELQKGHKNISVNKNGTYLRGETTKIGVNFQDDVFQMSKEFFSDHKDFKYKSYNEDYFHLEYKS